MTVIVKDIPVMKPQQNKEKVTDCSGNTLAVRKGKIMNHLSSRKAAGHGLLFIIL